MTKRKDDTLWQVTPAKKILTTPVMNVLTSQVVCKRSDTSRDFYRLDFSPWVNIIATTPTKDIVCIRQYRFGSGRIELEIPGGAVEPGEDPLDAGVRELLEETGYSGDNARIIGQVCPNPAIQDNVCYTVLVENAKKTSPPRLDDMEDIEVFTLNRDELLQLTKNGTLEHGLVLNALMFYDMTVEKRQ